MNLNLCYICITQALDVNSFPWCTTYFGLTTSGASIAKWQNWFDNLFSTMPGASIAKWQNWFDNLFSTMPGASIAKWQNWFDNLFSTMPEHALTGFLITFINSIVILHTCDFESVGEDATNHFLILVSQKKLLGTKKKKKKRVCLTNPHA